jgi:hypothetical protein
MTYADPVPANFFRIESTSAAHDAAAASTLVTDDIDGQPRTGTFDIGADEFQ